MEFLHSFLRRHFARKPVVGDVAKCRLLSQATIPKSRRIAERKQKTFIGGNTHSTETFKQLDFQTRCLEIRQIVFQISFVTS